MRWVAAVGLMMWSIAGAHAAQVASKVIDGKTVVTIDGPIDRYTVVEFEKATSSADMAIVALNSDGGEAAAGMAIGEIIHKRGYTTAILHDKSCASACAMIWIGGAKRIMQIGAEVGFHGVYILGPDGKPVDSRGGNAVVGAYYGRLGLSDDAIQVLTDTDPRSIHWLTNDEAQRLGIAVTTIPGVTPNKMAKREEPEMDGEEDSPDAGTAQASTDFAAAGRLARAFSRQYQRSGMSGINVSIDTCYAQARFNTSADVAAYCAGLDVLAYLVDDAMMKQLHATMPGSRNTVPGVKRRTSELAFQVGLDANTLRTRGSRIAVLAMKQIGEIVH